MITNNLKCDFLLQFLLNASLTNLNLFPIIKRNSMKGILLFALIVIGAYGSSATVRNVSNSPTAPVNSPYTYNDLQKAVDSAADGDSLYVHGTNIDYGVITITDKTLTLIGAGYGNNLMSNFQQKTYISRLQFAGYTGTKNVVLVGLFLPGSFSSISNISGGAVNNLLIDRCAMFRLTAVCNNLIMRQSIIEVGCDGTSVFSPTVNGNALIQNCVLAGNITGGNVNTSIWEQNIFKGTDCGVGTVSTYNGSATFLNNIFNNSFTVSVSNCIFNNNLFVSVASLGSGNGGTGNIFSTSAGFVNNASPVNAIGKENYCTAIDYHLSGSSAAVGAGTTGDDLGVYGGTYALPATAVLNGVPAMPRIIEMNVQNLSVSPTGNLNVQIKAVKEN
jgi:hypothetical protein